MYTVTFNVQVRITFQCFLFFCIMHDFIFFFEKSMCHKVELRLMPHYKFLMIHLKETNTQQNSYSISHLLDIVTTQWMDSDSVVTVGIWLQHGDWATNGSVVTICCWHFVKSDYTVTVQSLCTVVNVSSRCRLLE